MLTFVALYEIQTSPNIDGILFSILLDIQKRAEAKKGRGATYREFSIWEGLEE
jgi:hypothetical protein